MSEAKTRIIVKAPPWDVVREELLRITEAVLCDAA
jgi:hypothetical protein